MRTRQHQLYTLPENDLARVQVQRVLSDLDDFGDPNRIAAYLWTKDMRGKRCNDLDCPIGNFITDRIDAVGTTWVSPNWIAIYDSPFRHKSMWRVPVSLRNYPTVKKFIRRFDFGLYPNLLDNQSEPIYTG